MAQQTAVGFIEEQIKIYLPSIHQKGLEDVFEQAKAIEKEQHGETWDKALDAYESRGHLYVRAWSDFDEYYNETYNK